MKPLLTPRQVAELLGVKPVTVYAWVRKRKIPHVVLASGKKKECVRFKQSAIETWLEGREREAKGFTKWDKR